MSTRWKEVVCTNDEARKYFEDKGLSYKNISEKDIRHCILSSYPQKSQYECDCGWVGYN